MDLLVTTMTGNVFLFGTEVPYHPLKAWQSYGHGLNGFTAKENYHGIYFEDYSRHVGDVFAEFVDIDFTIVDIRPNKEGNRRYIVKLYVDGAVQETKDYSEPGTYRITFETPAWPTYSRVRIEMVNEHMQFFFDNFTISFHARYYRLLKVSTYRRWCFLSTVYFAYSIVFSLVPSDSLLMLISLSLSLSPPPLPFISQWLLVLPFFAMSTLLLFVKSLKPTLPISM